MNAFRTLSALVLVLSSTALLADDLVINGYTSAPPSIYLAPPLIVHDPFFVVPTQTVVYAPAYVPPVYAPAPVYAPSPVYLSPARVRVRERVNPREWEYKVKVYAPGRSAPVYSYKIDRERDGVKIRERYR